jgi:demethylmenaquinone methyltransferase/2-methoxy-6-polyprenyl-1,4-benzoquinol methylase
MSRGLSQLFSEVASTYDLTNHVLTLGLDIPWRRAAARRAAARGGRRWLDVCTGPGEMARNLAALAPAGTRIFAADFTPAMLLAGRRSRVGAPVHRIVCEAGQLPFPGETFDLVTISFATRNLNTSRALLVARFREFGRVLKPGGTFVNLETSQPGSAVIRAAFHLYVRTFVRPLGLMLSGSGPAYAYLASSIPRFHDPDRLSDLIREAGFGSVGFKRLMLGAAAIHMAKK